ncbi:MAG: GtrA family protein [Chloroflexota bacterium]|nr:GtrA family protein [Chloroflexota bacterium]
MGLAGIAVNQTALLLATEGLGWHYLLSALLATQLSSSFNFVGNQYWAFAGRGGRRPVWLRYLSFLALNNATLALRVPLLWLLTEVAGIGYGWSNLVSLGVLFALRFAVSDGWVWPAAGLDDADGASPARTARGAGRRARYRYDVAGVLRLDSDAELPELGYFRTQADTPPDIRIVVGRVGALPARRTRFVHDGAQLHYREQLGAAGANFSLTMGHPIEVRVSPLLALSRHVLYTNVVEALLRFVMVSKGYVLLHSACIAADGRAAVLSAQTDTGKTSTVIELVRDHGYQFLSDDMTILDPAGYARCYPKPMTLSFHTMRAALNGNGHSLRRGQRAKLAIQSRVHSKSGRAFGQVLGRLNIPIMSVNSAVQLMVPPPKYRIDALMAADIGERAPIGQVFLMERGAALRERLTVAEALDQLIANTDDAYGFPPFATFAPHIRIGDADYAALRRTERELLARALQRATVWRLRVPGHEWAELLPELMNGHAANGRHPTEPVGGIGGAPSRVPAELTSEVR